MTIYSPGGQPYLKVAVSDDSYRFMELMGVAELNLRFTLTEHKELPVGCYCIYPEQSGGQRYTLLKPAGVKVNHRRSFDYSAVFEGLPGNLKRHKLVNPRDGRLKFDYTARPKEHLKLLTDNLCERYGEGTWAVDDSTFDAKEKLVSFSHTNLLDALDAISKAFETEWEIVTRDAVNYIRLGKVKYNEDTPLPLSYGKNKGFISGVSRTNYDDRLPIGRVYIQGDERNIDYSKYPADLVEEGVHSATLLLPREMDFYFDGEHFSDEYGYVAGKGVRMVTDARGSSLSLYDAEADVNEDSLELGNVYPSRVGEVTEVLFWNSKTGRYVQKSDITDWTNIEVDIVDDTIPSGLNYSSCLMEGQKMTLIFQDGMLVARELDVTYRHNTVSHRPARRFELVKDTFDGQVMPSGVFLPEEGDTYAVFGIMLPDAYFQSKTTDTQHAGCKVYGGAEYEALRKTAQYLYKNKGAQYSFKGVLDGIYAKRNWENVSPYLVIGGYIRFRDESVIGQDAYYDLRIASFKDSINTPHTPIIELTDEEVYEGGGGGSGVRASIRQLEGGEVHTEERRKESVGYTRRGLRDVRETSVLLEEAFRGTWGSTSNPISLHTMQLLAGDESLQVRFWETSQCTGRVSNPLAVRSDGVALVGQTAYMQHLTLGGSRELTSGRTYADYYRWALSAITFSFADLDPDLAYYAYAESEWDDGGTETVRDAEYKLYPQPMTDTGDTRYFLLGILNSESGGTRSYTPVFGYTEILPSQVTTEAVRSADGETYFDLAGNEIGGRINFKDGLISGAIGISQDEENVVAGLDGRGGENPMIWAGAEDGEQESARFRVYDTGRAEYGDADGERIIINPLEENPNIEIYNEAGEKSVLLSGKEWDEGEMYDEGESAVTIPQVYCSVVGQNNKTVRNSRSVTFSLDNDSTVTIPSFTEDLTISMLGVTIGPMEFCWAAATLYIDGRALVTWGDVGQSGRSVDVPCTFPETELALNAGVHTFTLELALVLRLSGGAMGGGFASMYIPAITAAVAYNLKLCRYFANGNAIGYSNSNYIQSLIRKDNQGGASLLFSVRSGDYGFRVAEGGLEFRLGGVRYGVSRNSSTGALTLTPIND